MKRIIIAIFTLFSLQLLASESNDIQQEDILERMQMVRSAKILIKEQELLENKLKSWREHKQKLILEFERKAAAMQDMVLGHNNTYAQIRAKKRRREFYQSLKNKEDKIKKRLFDISKKLSDLKYAFLLRYAVPLTEGEMYHDIEPKIVDKEKKIKLLDEYIKYMSSYEELRKKNLQFEEVKSLLAALKEMNEREKAFDANMTKNAQATKMKMFEYKTMAQKLAEEFYNKYGIYISEPGLAKQFLENIKKYSR